ncbi:hypothetical protein Tco_0116484 [Tanacetum coccineum]
MVIKSEILNDFPRFYGVLIAEFAISGAVNLTLKMKRDMIIKNLDLKPKIDAMIGDFLEMSFRSFVVLLGGKNGARKRVVRSSQVEMDPAGRRSCQLLA